MRSKILLVSAIMIIIVAAFAVEDLPLFHNWMPDSSVSRPPIHHWTLDNGLEVFFWENHTVPVVSARIMVKTGSAYEGKYLGCGISHYLEHLVSSGTTSKHSEAEYKKMTQENAIATNAYTTSNITCYYGSGPAKNFDVLLSMLAEWVQDCQFDTFEVKRETKVIVQEMNMGLEEPSRVMWKLYNDLFYRISPYKYPTIGYRENFLRVTRDELIDYYHNRYAPNNAILAIAGDLDTAEVEHLVDSLWSGWVRQPINDVQIPLEPLPTAARVAEAEIDVKISDMKMGFPTAYYGDADLPALRVLSFILSGVSTSRLDLNLVQNKNPLMRSVYAYSSENANERGQFAIGGSFTYENRDTILSEIWNEIDRIKRYGVRQDEVEWAKAYIAKNTLRKNETVSGQASTMLYNFLTTGKPFTTDFYLQRINRVTREDVRRVAQKYLLHEHMILAITKPIGATCPNDTMLLSKKASHRPKFEERTLDNGLKLVLAENPAMPTIDMYIYLMGGTIFEPQDKPGIARFTTNYLSEGTRRYRSFEELKHKMDLLAIQMHTNCGMHTMYLSSSFISTDFDDALELSSEMLLNPIFPDESARKLRKKQLDNIKSQHDSWYSDAFLFFNEKFYGEHPYGRSVFGKEEAVKKFTADDAREYWFSHLDPKKIVIAAAGPVSVEVMADKITRYFGDIKSPDAAFPKIPQPEKHNMPEQFEKEVDRKQITLIIGYDGSSSRDEQDKWALAASGALLSGTGGLSGWLSIELRGKRNLVYVVWAGASSNLYGGRFTITTQCEPQDIDSVKYIILEQIDRLKNGDFEVEDANRITEALAERFMMYRQRQAGLVSKAGLDELYGFGFDYSEKYPEKIRAVSKDDIVRVANKYFNNPITVIMKPKITAE